MNLTLLSFTFVDGGRFVLRAVGDFPVQLQEPLLGGGGGGRQPLLLTGPLLGEGAGQEAEGDPGEEQEGGGDEEAQPPGAHPAGVLRGDGHAVWGRSNVRAQSGRSRCPMCGLLDWVALPILPAI